MRVLMIVTWYTPRSAEKMTAGIFHLEQSIALKKYMDVALWFPYDSEIKNVSKNEERGLLTYRSSSDSNIKVLKLTDYIKAGKKVVNDYKPDIIHAHVSQGAGIIAYKLSKWSGIPYIITEHSPIEQMKLDNPLIRLITNSVYKHSMANVCVSKDSMDRLGHIFPRCNYQVIYNGIINPDIIEDDGNTYRIEDFTNALITAAFYDKTIKGYQYLLPAIKKLKEDNVNIILHICGGGQYLDYYKKMSKDLGIEDRTVFYGQCDRKKVYSIMRQMDFSISASEFECSGVSVQEAMLLGNPMLVTRSGGANSLVTNKTAIVVDRKNVDALADGIKKMIDCLESFNRSEISQYANYNFEIDNVSNRYIKLYKQVVK